MNSPIFRQRAHACPQICENGSHIMGMEIDYFQYVIFQASLGFSLRCFSGHSSLFFIILALKSLSSHLPVRHGFI